MLGEQIGEERGQVLVRRVLPGEGPPKVEVSLEAQGTLVGISTTDIATYTSVIQPDGTIYGEGQGIVRSTDNSEIALWRGSGVGHFRRSRFFAWGIGASAPVMRSTGASRSLKARSVMKEAISESDLH